jgi:hypothetical protein
VLTRKELSGTDLLNQIWTIVLLASLCFYASPTKLRAQTPPIVVDGATSEILIQGLVTNRKKYSFTVTQDDTEYEVTLAKRIPIALKMNKPWFDWRNQQVVVDSVSFPNDPDENSKKRVGIKLPANDLYLISRFSDADQMTQIMSANIKRLNFYLITPEDQGHHWPTKDRPYISGSLSIQKNQQPRLIVKDQSMSVRLGFRYATMNGFSIMDLEPNKTQVFLAGIPGDKENEVLATRILFQPVRVSESPAEKLSKN